MEEITKRQKRFLAKWTILMGIVCGIVTGIVLLATGQDAPVNGTFWFQIIVAAMGGGILLGLIPAVLVEYRRTTIE